MVTLMVIKQFKHKDDIIFTVNPDFNDIQYIEPESTVNKGTDKVFYLTEEEKVNRTSEAVRKAYYKLKDEIVKLDKEIIFNPQKYYLSIQFVRNIAFLNFADLK